MAYNDYIDSSSGDGAALIPEEYSREIIKDVVETGWIFQRARRLPNIPVNQERMPVVSGLINAGFIDSSGGEAGVIPTSEMTWQNKYITAAKIGVLVPLTSEVLDDSAFPIWEEVQAGITDAINVAVARAVLYGTGAPSAWTTDIGDDEGIVGFATTASQTASLASFNDAYEAIWGESGDGNADGVVGLLEADGFYPTAYVGHPTFRTTLRNTRTSDGDPIFPMGSSLNDLLGTPAEFPIDDSISKDDSLLIAGDWSKLVYAWRTDMSFRIFDTGTLEDLAGNTTLNLLTQDMSAMRVIARVGFAMPNPINRMQDTESDRSPFAVLTA